MPSPEVTTPKSEEEPEHHGDQGGTTDGGQGGMTDGGDSWVGPKRRGNRGGRKHRKKQNTGNCGSEGSWHRVPGGASGASGSEESWKQASRNYTKDGGYMQASRKARGWG